MSAEPTMRAAVWVGPDELQIADVARPEVPEGWALLEVELTGLCGTDFAILHGSHPRAAAPLVMGHEIVGRVVVAAADGPRAGTRVVVEPLITCGQCWPCRHGASHVCQQLQLYGIDRPGSLAEFVAVPAAALVPISDHVDVAQAALAEPLAVAVHAVKQATSLGGGVEGSNVVVFGAGPIGILVALMARHRGASRILVVEPSALRVDVAADLGFETPDHDANPVEAVRAWTDGVGADVVFDSAAHPSVAAILPRCTRIQGAIVFVGVYKAPTAVDLQALTFAEQRTIGVRVYTRRDMEEAAALIESGILGLHRVPTQVFDLADTAQAFSKAMAATEILKVLVRSGPARQAG